MDPRLIVQVIINIVNNAIEYTPAGSHITIRSEKRTERSSFPLPTMGPGSQIRKSPGYSICFYSGGNPIADSRRNCGIGLSLCRSIIDAHGGADCFRQCAPWSSLYIYIASGGRYSLMNKPLILVVEDDRSVNNLITTILKTHDYRYLTALNGAEAVLEASSHNPDIVLLDLGLPDTDGVDIIKKIRTWSNMPIIVISARNEDKDKIEALDAGADDYLTKPFSVEELLARLRATTRRLSASGQTQAEDAVFENGELRIEYAAGCAWLGDKELHLTPIEYKLLCLLARNVGKVLDPHVYYAADLGQQRSQ